HGVEQEVDGVRGGGECLEVDLQRHRLSREDGQRRGGEDAVEGGGTEERWAEEALGVGVLQRLDVERPVADLERLGEGGVDGGRLRRRGGPDQRGAAEAGGDPVDGGVGGPGVGRLAEELQAVSWLGRLSVEGAGTEGGLAPARPSTGARVRGAGGASSG